MEAMSINFDEASTSLFLVKGKHETGAASVWYMERSCGTKLLKDPR